MDRALYLPEQWTDDRSRCKATGIPDLAIFATKPQLASAIAGVPCGWVTVDKVYG
uniref:transposase n=1 Tax=Xenorhabdus sp. PB61.4 TaxID=2788940 RepID=UPI001E5278DC